MSAGHSQEQVKANLLRKGQLATAKVPQKVGARVNFRQLSQDS